MVIKDKIKAFLKEMDSGGVSSLAPDNMIKLVDINKSEGIDDDDQVSNIRPRGE